MSEIIFSHSGDLGDIIYALPTIKAIRKSDDTTKLILFNSPGKTSHGLDEIKVNRLRPLLEAQPYLSEVIWSDTQYETSLNGFRDHHGVGNLADMHLATHGLPWTHRQEPWLEVNSLPSGNYPKVIISRSPRYHNSNFPWKRVVETYQKDSIFIGFLDEYAEFVKNYGYIPFQECDNFLLMAQLIKASKLFIGNQSSPCAVAHGLRHPMVQCICPNHSHSLGVFERMNCIIGWDHKIELPELGDL